MLIAFMMGQNLVHFPFSFYKHTISYVAALE